MDRRQESHDMVDRLTNMNIPSDSEDYEFPIEDIIKCISNERIQCRHDISVAKQKYGASVAHDADDCFWFWFVSPKWTWENLCGRAGWMILSKKDLRQIEYFLEIMN